MSQGFVLLALVVLAFLFSMLAIAGFQIVRSLVSVAKCPDCGRIMQHVLYEENEEDRAQQTKLECPFCKSKQIRRIHPGKKLTMYP